jgi:hypothetical protein
LVRRDENGAYDFFELSFDSNNDQRTGYRFRVSAANVQRDVFLYNDTDEDEAWDAVWQSAVNRDSSGWSVELRIPLSQLTYISSDSAQSWGVNFSRRRLASNERTYNTGPADPGDPFFDGSDASGTVGVDARFGLGSAYTLNATINPDFGQVEVDPAVINLTQFEVFFPERRPFFVEDAQIFDFTLSGHRNQLFYSRRIGREPRGVAPDGADFEEVPGETTILGAAKLTGRTAGGLSVGALAAFTGEETGRAYFNDLDQTLKFPVEPPAQYGVLRLQQDMRGGASLFGGIFTAMNRSLPSDGRFASLTSNAYSLGLDFEHNWGGANSRNWALWGYFAGTHIRGDPIALIEVQESSNHYYQRPDADYLSVDSTARSLTGINWRVQFERRSAQHWTGAVWAGQISPGFEANDLGFLQASERLDLGARISYQEITPGSLFRSYELRLFTFQNWRHSILDDPFSINAWQHAHKSSHFSLNTEWEFLNYWELNVEGSHSPQLLSDSDTRGGPLIVRPATSNLELRLETDRRKALFLEPRLDYQKRHLGGDMFGAGMAIGIRPSPSLEVSLAPSYTTELDPAQYVETTEDMGYAPTYGSRYLFSDLRRHQFSVETRLNVAFNPKLTLQLYAQPLISSGDYLTYKQLEAAETFDFDVFEEGVAVESESGISCVGGRTCAADDTRFIDFEGDGTVDYEFENPPFNIQSLRLNAVLRWEYRPGSTVFFVWQQNRRDRIDTGSFDLSRDFDLLRSIEPENVFIVKVNYWLGL